MVSGSGSKFWRKQSRTEMILRENAKMRETRAKAPDTAKMSQAFGEAAEATAFFPPPGLEAPPALSLVRFTAPVGLVPESPRFNRIRDYKSLYTIVESDDESTSVGTVSNSNSGSSDGEKDTEPTAKEFQMKANAPSPVTSYLADLQAAAQQLPLSGNLQAAELVDRRKHLFAKAMVSSSPWCHPTRLQEFRGLLTPQLQ